MLLLVLLSPIAVPAQEFPKIPSDATAKTLEGETVSLAEHKGKLIFLNLWKTDCVPCLLEIPILNRLQKEYGSDEFTVIGVSLDRGKDELVNHFVEKAKIKYPVWLVYDQPLLEYVEVPFTPFLLVVGPEGEVLGYIPGKIPAYKDAVGIMNQARSLLAGQKVQK